MSSTWINLSITQWSIHLHFAHSFSYPYFLLHCKILKDLRHELILTQDLLAYWTRSWTSTEKTIDTRLAPRNSLCYKDIDMSPSSTYILWKHGETRSLRFGVRYLSLLHTGHWASSSCIEDVSCYSLYNIYSCCCCTCLIWYNRRSRLSNL